MDIATTPQRYKINTTAFAHFWTAGAGVELLKKLGHVPDVSKADEYKDYLFAYDADGDAVCNALLRERSFPEMLGTLKTYLEGGKVSADLQETLDEFYRKCNVSPAWLDMRLLETGAELCRRTGIPGLLVLRNYCLMGGYESAAINKPLIYTGALKKGAAKRLADTTLFWIGITRPGVFKQGGEGLHHVFSTRLIHSFSRINILQRTDWDSQQWGMPLNTWDMLATQLGFSLVFLTGLRRMGFNPSDEEVAGLFHMWKYIGYLLGIPVDLLPDTEEQAIEALYYWTMTQSGSDKDSTALAKALVDETIQSSFPRLAIMRSIMQQIHLYYNYFFLGDYSCRLLGIPAYSVAIPPMLLWRLRMKEKQMHLVKKRDSAIKSGGDQQANALKIYLEHRSKEPGWH